ncbi:MAG: 50S ribosomal protein L18Ae [Candidatus Micrarchaeia archaeon]
MVKFIVSGKIKLQGKERVFEKEIDAQSEKHAKENIYAVFGSKNGLKRTNIKIERVQKQ